MSQQYKSSVSQHSRSVSQFINEYEELTDAELIKQVDDLKNEINMLNLENEILERTILRLEPALMHGVQQALEYASKLQSNSSLTVSDLVKSQTSRVGGLDSSISPSKMFTSPSRVSTRRVESSAKIGGTVVFGTGIRINVLERSELVAAEMEILINNMEKARHAADKQHAYLKAQLEEISVRENEIEKASHNFNDEVIVGGWDKIAQRIPAEIWIRYMTEWVKIADSQIGKLRLRTSTLNTQYSILKRQIKVKTDLSEGLRAVDFEKLTIENNECEAIIEKKVQQLSELKKMTGDANLTLTIHKKAMIDQNNHLDGIIKGIKKKEKLTIELDKEKEKIKVQADSLDQKLDEIRKLKDAYEIPDIMDYVKVKSEVTDIQHSVKVLENRARIQQIALTSLNKKLMSIKNV